MNPAAPNPYEVLGVDRDASQDDIRSAYRRLALQHHPDRNQGDKTAEEAFKRISQAYATLRDPELRARYDRFGNQPSNQPQDFSTVDWQTIFREADIHVDWSAGRSSTVTGSAIFDALFGVVTNMMRTAGLAPGEERAMDIRLPIHLLRTGGQARVRVPGPAVCGTCRGARIHQGSACHACGGRGFKPGGEHLDVNIPPQVRPGTRLRLRGLGGPGSPPGDALVTLLPDLPSGVTLQGNDLHSEIHVTPLEANRGVTTTLFGTRIRIPPGAANGGRLRLRGAGLAAGDLILTIRHDVWRGLVRAGRDLLQRFRSSGEVA